MRSGITTQDLDTTVSPADDLFGYANGTWLRTTEIPSDRPGYGSFLILADEAEHALHEIAEEAAAADAEPGSAQQLVGDLYRSFMDVDRAEELGVEPVRDRLDEALGVTTTTDLFRLLGRVQAEGAAGAFAPYVDTDHKDSTRYVVYVEQGGLGLPDEAYYREEQYEEIRAAYVAHIAAMFSLAGIGGEDDARAVFDLETRLAAGHWDVVRTRDVVATYNLVDQAGLADLAPHVDWAAWLDGLGAPDGAFDQAVVREPSYLQALSDQVEQTDLAHWRLWLAWQVLHDAAPYLSSPVVQENWRFYQRTLYGVPEQRERWKRGVALVEASIGEAAGRLYVERHFPPEAKERMSRIVENLVEAYRRSITDLAWMGEETRVKALAKLDRFTPKIGYPDTWRDYSRLRLTPGDLIGNVRAAREFETRRELGKLGGPVDRGEWFMSPQTVNAYYNPGMNEIVFPAAILQPPFFHLDADDAVNYGGIGAVIGHEIGHGFDDQGSRYDGDGNLVDWWTEDDRARFDELTRSLIDQYAGFEPRDLPGRTVNGALTVGENIGDLGGLAIAYEAWRISGGQDEPAIDGFTGSQRVFLGWAQVWKGIFREEAALRRLSVDPHSPAEFRANVVRNLDEFYAAFDVKQGDDLWLEPKRRVRIW